MPSFSTRCATSSISSTVRGCSSPLALCRKNGIGTPQLRWREMHQSGTPGDHSVQTRLAPARDEFGLGDGFQRSLAQGSTLPGLLVHADEPLRGGAIDQRRLVPPAVHVAVMMVSWASRLPTLQLGHHVELAFQMN